MLRATLLPVYDGVDEVYYAHTLQLPRISKRSFAGTTSVPRKSDTARAVCKSNPEHGVYSPVQYSAPSVRPFPPPLLPFSLYARARTCLMYKRQNAPGRSIPIISLWSGSYCGIAVLPYTGAACPKRKGYDMCKHTCSRSRPCSPWPCRSSPVDSTELYAAIARGYKGHDVNRLPEDNIYVLVRR